MKLKYFVLKPKAKHFRDNYALASQVAMHAYAEAIRFEDPVLANDLHAWASQEDANQRALQTDPKFQEG